MQRRIGISGLQAGITCFLEVWLICSVTWAWAGSGSVRASERSFGFDADPGGEVRIEEEGYSSTPWRPNDGNPGTGGFLALTYPMRYQHRAIVFPDIDESQRVNTLRFEADVRFGNGYEPLSAGGFSVSFARPEDPVLVMGGAAKPAHYARGELPGGTQTGLSVSFDTWSSSSGSTDRDLAGVVVSVDGRVLCRQPLETRNGACTDPTSAQTGARDAAYWEALREPTAPASWASLCWQTLAIDLALDGAVSVTWKGRLLVDRCPTSYFPTALRLVLAGGAINGNQQVHFDNVRLRTAVLAPDVTPPTSPTGLHAAEVGARRVRLVWNPSTDEVGSIRYHVARDGVGLEPSTPSAFFEDSTALPTRTYRYEVWATDSTMNASGKAMVTNVTTQGEVTSPAIIVAEFFDGIPGTTLEDIFGTLRDPRYPSTPDRSYYVDSLGVGDAAHAADHGDYYTARLTGVVIPPETGSYRFFVRSDDSSMFFLNRMSSEIPDAATSSAIAFEQFCCSAFQEPGALQTSAPIPLVKGQRCGFLYLLKEGAGYDYGYVAWRREGDPTPAELLRPIQGVALEGQGDPVGARLEIIRQPFHASVSGYQPVSFRVEAEGHSPYGIEPRFQWYRNGESIIGATNRSYTIPRAQPGDHGARFRAWVGIVGTNVVSSEAVLTVMPVQAPRLVSVEGDDSLSSAVVVFDQPVTPSSASQVANYELTGGLQVVAATVLDPDRVRLTTSRQEEGSVYVLKVRQVRNPGGASIEYGSSAAFRAWSLISRRVRADDFTGVAGFRQPDIDAAIRDARFPARPDAVRFLTHGISTLPLDLVSSVADPLLTAIRGVLKPRVSGAYRFFVRGDASTRVFLNRNGPEIPVAAVGDLGIAHGENCCWAFGDPTGTVSSEPIALESGRSYGVLFLVKTEGWTRTGEVAWRREGDPTEASALQAIRDEVYWYGPTTVVDPTASVPGVLKLDGTRSYATAIDSVWPRGSTLTDFTWEAWVRSRGDPRAQFLVADDAYEVAVNGAALSAALYDPDASVAQGISPRALVPDRWTHVAATFDGSSRVARIAVDGVLGPSLPFDGGFYDDSNQRFTLGARRLGPKALVEGLFAGEIDEVRVSDVVRYAQDFTPPVRFNEDSQARALYHFDEPAGATSFADSSGYGHTLEGLGGATVVAGSGPTRPDAGLVGYWPLDEVGGDVVHDSSRNDNTGLLRNTAARSTGGKFGGCLSFDGGSAMVEIPNSRSLEVGRGHSDFSVAFWVKMEGGATGTWRALMQKGGGRDRTFALFLHQDSNRIHYRVSTGTDWNEGGDSVGSLVPGAWTHVALVKSGTQLRLYLNGVLDHQRQLPSPVVHNAKSLYLGGHPSLPGAKCLLDEVRVYCRPLEETEILELAALVGDWRFSEGSGFTIHDQSPYQHHGTLEGGGQSPSWVERGEDHALSFDGVDDIAAVIDSRALDVGKDNQDFSVLCWIRLEQGFNGQWRVLLQKGQGTARTFSLFLNPDSNRIHYRVSTAASWNEGGDSLGSLPVGIWTHLGLVKAGAKLRLYLNGRLDHETTLRSNVISNPNPLYLGRTPSVAGTRMVLDDLKIFRCALPEAALGSVGHDPYYVLTSGFAGHGPSVPVFRPVVILHKEGSRDSSAERAEGASLDSPSAKIEGDQFIARFPSSISQAQTYWGLEVSEDLIHWAPSDDVDAVIEPGGGAVVLRVRLPIPGMARQFFRVRGVLNP